MARKKKRADRTFSASTQSPLIARFQNLTRDKDGHYPWARMLDQKEMNFVYDMLANAEARRDFIPTSAQGNWLARIYIKIEAAKRQWKDSRGTREKMPSIRQDVVARRRAKKRLAKAGIISDKNTPPDSELVELLFAIGDINDLSTEAPAKEQLIKWSELQASTDL